MCYDSFCKCGKRKEKNLNQYLQVCISGTPAAIILKCCNIKDGVLSIAKIILFYKDSMGSCMYENCIIVFPVNNTLGGTPASQAA